MIAAAAPLRPARRSNGTSTSATAGGRCSRSWAPGSLRRSTIGDGSRSSPGRPCCALDIDTSETGRLYGDRWYRFLGRCRAMLGVESGTSYLDLEDEVYRDYAAASGRRQAGHARGADGRAARALDHNYSYRTISPRHFEAAAFRICQVLFEGEYSGVLQPMVHYLPLKKDFSNFEEVVRQLSDDGLRREIADNAHRDLIASERYPTRRLVGKLDDDLSAAGLKPRCPRAQRASDRRGTQAGSREAPSADRGAVPEHRGADGRRAPRTAGTRASARAAWSRVMLRQRRGRTARSLGRLHRRGLGRGPGDGTPEQPQRRLGQQPQSAARAGESRPHPPRRPRTHDSRSAARAHR